MKTIEIDDCTYRDLKNIADLIGYSINDLLYNAVSDGVINDYYDDEITAANKLQMSEDEIRESVRDHWMEVHYQNREENKHE